MSIKIPSAITNVVLNEATFDNQEFTPTYINFLYGNNGSGKSTVAKSIKEQHGLTWESGYTTDNYTILVYNEDFIKKNIESYDNMPGVFTISEKNIAIQHQIDDATEQLRIAQKLFIETHSKLGEQEALISKQYEAFQQICWDKTKDLRDALKAALEGKKKKEGFTKALLAEKAPQDFDEKSLIAICEAAFSSEAATYHELQSGDATTLPDSPLMSKIIVSRSDSPFATFMKAINATNWVRQGHEEFHQAADGKCPYCQKPLDDDFEAEIASCFDAVYEADIADLRTYKDTYGMAANSIWRAYVDNLKCTYPKIADELKSFSILFETFKAKTQLNAQKFDEKLKAPNTVVDLEYLSDIISDLNDIVASINKQIQENNAIVNDKTKKQPECQKNAMQYLTYRLRDEIDTYLSCNSALRKEIDRLTKLKTDTEKNVRNLKGSISKLRKQVVNTAVAAEGINIILKDTGFQGFYLREKEDAPNVYEVIRTNTKKIVVNLSEGERNFIAFLYFYQLILGSEDAEVNIKDKVVVIDDPVSSMDSSALLVVGALVRDLIAICNPDFITKEGNKDFIKQLFVLTHNPFFHQDVTYNQVQNFRHVSFFEITKLENQSSVNHCTQRRPGTPFIIENRNPVQNSYAALWDTYNEVTSPNTLVNVIRQILDYYFLQLCGYDGVGIKDKILKEHRNDFVKKLEDNTEDCTELHMAASLLQYITTSNDRISDGLNFIHTSMDTDYCRKIFEKIFRNMGQGQHYDMMTKCSRLA